MPSAPSPTLSDIQKHQLDIKSTLTGMTTKINSTELGVKNIKTDVSCPVGFTYSNNLKSAGMQIASAPSSSTPSRMCTTAPFVNYKITYIPSSANSSVIKSVISHNSPSSGYNPESLVCPNGSMLFSSPSSIASIATSQLNMNNEWYVCGIKLN